MPYIDKQAQEKLKSGAYNAETPGELNFLITSIIDKYLFDNNLRYGTINDVIGVLECAKLELYRRIAAPYENKKMRENGDVYVTQVV